MVENMQQKSSEYWMKLWTTYCSLEDGSFLSHLKLIILRVCVMIRDEVGR